jgi:hypothetical protein
MQVARPTHARDADYARRRLLEKKRRSQAARIILSQNCTVNASFSDNVNGHTQVLLASARMLLLSKASLERAEMALAAHVQKKAAEA